MRRKAGLSMSLRDFGPYLNLPDHLKPIHAADDSEPDNRLNARIREQEFLGNFVEGGAGADCVINQQ